MFCRETLFDMLVQWLLKRNSGLLFRNSVFAALVLQIIIVSFIDPFINKSFVLFYTFFLGFADVQINLLNVLGLIQFIELTNIWMFQYLLSCQSFVRIELHCLQDQIDSLLMDLWFEPLLQFLLRYFSYRFQHTLCQRWLNRLNVRSAWSSCKRHNFLKLV